MPNQLLTCQAGRRPYKTNKNDVADAEAICEAVGRPNMRFVPIKSIEQQAILSVHRVRQGFVKARTAQANQIRGLLSEMGLVIPQGIRFHRPAGAGIAGGCQQWFAAAVSAAHMEADEPSEGAR
jgi:transposase